MNTDLYRHALAAEIIAREYQSYCNGKDSRLLARMYGVIRDKKAVTTLFERMGQASAAQTAAYLECFADFGAEDEYRRWSQDPVHIRQAMKAIEGIFGLMPEAENETCTSDMYTNTYDL